MQPAQHCPGVNMSRWKYRTEIVTVGENSQKVRGMTQGERTQFAEASTAIKEGNRKATELPGMIACFGCVDPSVTAKEVEEMPTELVDAVVSAIMRLSGMKDPEKKGPALPAFPELTGQTVADQAPTPTPPTS